MEGLRVAIEVIGGLGILGLCIGFYLSFVAFNCQAKEIQRMVRKIDLLEDEAGRLKDERDDLMSKAAKSYMQVAFIESELETWVNPRGESDHHTVTIQAGPADGRACT